MGGACCGGSCFHSVYDEMKQACLPPYILDPLYGTRLPPLVTYNDYDNLDKIKGILASPKGQHYDVYRIIHQDEKSGKQYDCISLFLSHVQPYTHYYTSKALMQTPVLEFLKLMKEQIDKNKKNGDKISFSPPQLSLLHKPYIEYIADFPSTKLETFQFMLDNSDAYFPLNLVATKSKEDEDQAANNFIPKDNSLNRYKNNQNHEQISRPSALLHCLCSEPRNANLLSEYMSSGKIEEIYKNNSIESNTARMRHPHWSFLTPLQVACSYWNTTAVGELVTNKIGGTNYGESLYVMMKKAGETCKSNILDPTDNSWPRRNSDLAKSRARDEQRKIEPKLVAIFLLILSQSSEAVASVKELSSEFLWLTSVYYFENVKECLSENGITAAS